MGIDVQKSYLRPGEPWWPPRVPSRGKLHQIESLSTVQTTHILCRPLTPRLTDTILSMVDLRDRERWNLP